MSSLISSIGQAAYWGASAGLCYGITHCWAKASLLAEKAIKQQTDDLVFRKQALRQVGHYLFDGPLLKAVAGGALVGAAIVGLLEATKAVYTRYINPPKNSAS